MLQLGRQYYRLVPVLHQSSATLVLRDRLPAVLAKNQSTIVAGHSYWLTGTSAFHDLQQAGMLSERQTPLISLVVSKA